MDNKAEVVLPPGQPVVVQTAHHSYETRPLVPAASLEGWRGIAAFIPPSREAILQMRLSRPGLVEAGPGLILGVKGSDTGAVDLIRRFLHAPEHPVLRFAAARQLMAALVAEDVGRALRAADQAALRPAKRA